MGREEGREWVEGDEGCRDGERWGGIEGELARGDGEETDQTKRPATAHPKTCLSADSSIRCEITEYLRVIQSFEAESIIF